MMLAPNVETAIGGAILLAVAVIQIRRRQARRHDHQREQRQEERRSRLGLPARPSRTDQPPRADASVFDPTLPPEEVIENEDPPLPKPFTYRRYQLQVLFAILGVVALFMVYALSWLVAL